MFGFIYIAGEIDGLHKVGYTAQPLERLINLQRQYGADITYSAMVYIKDTVMRDAERATHEMLGHDKRVTGEWFELSQGGADTVTRFLTKRYGGRMLKRDEIEALVTGRTAPCRDCGVTCHLSERITWGKQALRVLCRSCRVTRDAKMSQLPVSVTRERKITRNDVTRAAADKRNALRETGVTSVTPSAVTSVTNTRNALHETSVTRDTGPRDTSHITSVTSTRNAWSRVTAWVRRWLNWQP